MNDWQPDVTFEDGVFRFDLPNGDEFVIVPPKPKELSDEEILQQAEWMFGTHFFEMIDDPYWIEFARAILKKASFTCNGFCGEQECKENKESCNRIKKASEK